MAPLNRTDVQFLNWDQESLKIKIFDYIDYSDSEEINNNNYFNSTTDWGEIHNLIKEYT